MNSGRRHNSCGENADQKPSMSCDHHFPPYSKRRPD
jgi:hypothetical protein